MSFLIYDTIREITKYCTIYDAVPIYMIDKHMYSMANKYHLKLLNNTLLNHKKQVITINNKDVIMLKSVKYNNLIFMLTPIGIYWYVGDKLQTIDINNIVYFNISYYENPLHGLETKLSCFSPICLYTYGLDQHGIIY